ncbi:uncharacterized protein LOC111633457 isoform X3 [Centruroides sculpturatus]|uniref:uncharacterized protein LOC111633457 isoform X3 n=1 Tax=Centruroides sculpturatus TaxID=218467 RepID=UPI000C6CEAA8|nr:uncharacterized protein LOC111633457 isoform X3 [Centruroides sculpturatus]
MQTSPSIRLRVTNFQQEICLKCFLSSFTSMSMIYGWNFFNSCSCVTRNHNYQLNFLKTFYLSLIECFYWLHFFLTFCMILPFVSYKTPCISWYSIVDNDIFVKKISEDLYVLRKDNPNLELELEEIMAQHHEIWSYTNQLNGPFNYVLTILYATLLTETCLLYFIAIFSKVEFALKVFIFLICALITFLCVLVGFLMSVFTSNMQTSFQDTRIFADCDLSLEQKLKMLNFMKRFGKASLCLSMNDYFNVTKKFPIKMASSLHSVFSGLLKLRTATRRKN